MTLIRYTGNAPSNVSKDAKYSVRHGSFDHDEITLLYRVSNREKTLLATRQHPVLVEMVNAVKVDINGQPRGVFYINEFHDVLVPDGEGGAYYAGNYSGNLEFKLDGGGVLRPDAPAGLSAGRPWPGPRVGIRHTLMAGGNDIRFVVKSGRSTTEVWLSDHVGQDAAAQTARRIAQFIGNGGGRFYVNERGEMFAPPRADGTAATYLGSLDESAWFHPPEGYSRG